MRFTGRPFARLAMLIGIAVFCSTTPSGSAAPDNAAGLDSQSPLARSFYPEVRLRKLHLVRPDLIPYPIAYEIYC
ncbi:MAG TPA: hypothetical protein VFC78_01085 [Tepidisphaeraceae bacterium]|nr:hypothetical protein [Tepidisphaeraceae bacterium]